MTKPIPYKSGDGLWSAATERARATSESSGVAAATLLRRFILDRFLARVFALPGDEWVLKGGNAMLSRVYDARATKDIDLLAELTNLDEAAAKLQAATRVNLNDHFRFVVTKTRRVEGSFQAAVKGYKVSIDAYCGVRRRGSFSVDLVTGSLMTTDPDIQTQQGLIPTIPPAHVRVYPVVDHIADKLCAIQGAYGTKRDQPSSRVRDLVDVVVFARTQQIDGSDLANAIDAEWKAREHIGDPLFDPPVHWKDQYNAIAKNVPACGEILTFDAAVELAGSLLVPAIDGNAIGLRWSPEALLWLSG